MQMNRMGRRGEIAVSNWESRARALSLGLSGCRWNIIFKERGWSAVLVMACLIKDGALQDLTGTFVRGTWSRFQARDSKSVLVARFLLQCVPCLVKRLACRTW